MTRERYESLPLATLKELAKARNMKGVSTLKKSALIDEMLKLDETEKQMQANEKAKEEVRQEMKEKKEESDIEQLDSGKTAKGIFELHQDGYGFIRSDNYLPGEQDVYVAPSQIRRFGLKTGDILTGNTRIKTQGEKFSALLYVSTDNGLPPEGSNERKNFEDLTPIFPRKDQTGKSGMFHGNESRRSDFTDREGTAWYDRVSSESRKDHFIKRNCTFRSEDRAGYAYDHSSDRRTTGRSDPISEKQSKVRMWK